MSTEADIPKWLHNAFEADSSAKKDIAMRMLWDELVAARAERDAAYQCIGGIYFDATGRNPEWTGENSLDEAREEILIVVAAMAAGKQPDGAVEAAARDMRERCIKIVDDHTKGMDNEWNRNLGRAEDFVDFGTDIMDAIRALPDTPTLLATDGETNG